MYSPESHHHWPEEVANAVTHGIGALLSVSGLTLLVTRAAGEADPWRIVSVSIFGATLVLMYLASTLYHALPHPPVRKALRICDHCAIFLLIAGTYTPFLLVSLRGPWGWSLFVVVWGCALVGCILKIVFLAGGKHGKKLDYLSTALYVGMGWVVVIALKPAVAAVSPGGMLLTLIGGLAYTGGVAFYLWERLPYNHAIWHVCVLAGSVTHFFAVFSYILPVPQAGG